MRLADNPALAAAVQRGAPIIPLYIDEGTEESEWTPGAAARWWLQRSLSSLESALRAAGSRLILRRGAALAVLQTLCGECAADAVYWNRCYEPAARARDTLIKSTLRAMGLLAESRNATLLIEPGALLTKEGRPFQVYTPFRRRLLEQLRVPAPIARPTQLPAPRDWPDSVSLAQLQLLPRLPWYHALASAWQPGEAGAEQQMHSFIDSALSRYATQRDLPAIQGSSRLSPHLHHGEISIRQLWHSASLTDSVTAGDGPAKFHDELIWREFAAHLLHHFPETPAKPLRAEFLKFPWQEDRTLQRAWQRGLTGVPIVDAGMRELWSSGWMHNRVRMIAASFLVKNLRQPWQAGARWFWDTLVDADLAANTLGWQWVAGCGADAAPFFRIFNPVTQSRKFDPQGTYLRRWLPELARLSDSDLHAPWLADAAQLRVGGVVLGRDYPQPIVDLQHSRAAALAAWRNMRA